MEETGIITCLKERKRDKKNIKKIVVRLENSRHNDKMHFKIAIAKIFLFVLLLIFKRYDGVLIIKALIVWPHFGHT